MSIEYQPGGSLANLLAWRAAERPEFALLYVEADGPWTIGSAGRRRGPPSPTTLDRARRGPRSIACCCASATTSDTSSALTAIWLRGASAIAMHPSAPVGDAPRTVASMAAVVVVGDPDDAFRHRRRRSLRADPSAPAR